VIAMKKIRMMSLAVAGMVIVSLAVTITASPLISSTPLFIFRMEQVSSEKNFLPTERNTFTYTTQEGYRLNYDVAGCFGPVVPLITGVETCDTCGSPVCIPDPESLSGTCDQHTCGDTCWYTCSYVNTCPNTCEDTCPNTCGVPTCGNTCGDTCPETECDPQCSPPP